MSKTALITGSTKGLGLATANFLANSGINILLTGRSQEKLNEILETLPKKSDRHHAFCVDLTQELQLKTCLRKIAENNLMPDIIIHNVGGVVEGDGQPLNVDVLRRSMKINLEVALVINEFFLPVMLEKHEGRIIHISSDASLTGMAAPGYVAAKAAVNAYVKSAARFYAKYNIMVCGILPGIFEHEESAWAIKKKNNPEYYQNKLKEMPLGRFGRTEEIASIIADLACSETMMCAGSLIQLNGAYA